MKNRRIRSIIQEKKIKGSDDVNIGNVTSVIDLVKQISDPRNPTVPKGEEMLSKPVFRSGEIVFPFERTSPEAEGVPSGIICDFLSDIANDETLDMQDVMILRNGKVICETAFGMQDLKIWKQTYSACKSITSIAVGFAIEEGLFSLDTKVWELFPDDVGAVTKLTMKDVTVEHLLTMTSTVVFAEAEALVAKNWVRSFLSSTTRGEAGVTFNYNSLNTYMLAAAVSVTSGMSLTEYLTPRLFEPLGIGVGDIHWEMSPDGIEKGGWGLFIRPEDMAKIGECFLSGGVFRGKQVIPKGWVETAAVKKSDPPRSCGAFDYGYQMWCGRDSDTFLFNGMLGQNVLGFRDSHILIVTNAGNNETFQQSNYFDCVLRYFGDPTAFSDGEAEAVEADKRRLNETVCSVSRAPTGTKNEDLMEQLDGKVFVTDDPAAGSFGVLPLALQIAFNNYTAGLESISFKRDGEKFYLLYRERDAIHRIPVGFDRPASVNMRFRDQVFRCTSVGRFGENEDGVPVLTVTSSFTETPFTRVIKVFFKKDLIILRQTETPTAEFVVDNLGEILRSLEENKFLKRPLGMIDSEYLMFKASRAFSPELKMEIRKESDQ